MRKPNKNWIKRKCLTCGQFFLAEAYYVKIGLRIFCSRPCLSSSNGKKKCKNQEGEKNSNWKGGITKNNYHYKIIQKQRYPERIKAINIVSKAKKSGKLIPLPCKICGYNKNIQAHHEDYSKPLEVIWLCRVCHIQTHNTCNKINF